MASFNMYVQRKGKDPTFYTEVRSRQDAATACLVLARTNSRNKFDYIIFKTTSGKTRARISLTDATYTIYR